MAIFEKVKIRNYDFGKNDILLKNLIVIWKVLQIKIISAWDQNSNMPFLKNEFSKILRIIRFKVNDWPEK